MSEQAKQPHAHWIANLLDENRLAFGDTEDKVKAMASEELRRLHAIESSLQEQLAAIGAGGVESLRQPRSCLHKIQEPVVNQQLTSEREAFEQWLGIKPCGAAHDFGWSAWKARAALAATPAADAPAQTIERQRMTAGRASFFMERFLREEKLLGPNEQAALHFVIDMLEAAAAPVVLPEPVPTPCRSMFATQREYADAMAQHRKNWAEIEAERALLATGGQAQAVEQAPVLYVSKGQLDNHRDPDGPDSANAGRYLPCRITPAGKFTTPLFAAPQAQAEARDAELLDFLEANAASLTLEDGLWEIVVRGKTMNWATDGKTAREAIAAAKGAQK